VRTSCPAALSVLQDARFQQGDFDTHFLESMDLSTTPPEHDGVVAVAAAIARHHQQRRTALKTSAADRDAWVARSRAGVQAPLVRVSTPGGGA
jgi:hypothetical protein